MLQYIGNNEEEYFLIIDAASKRKYVLSLPAHSLTRKPANMQRTTCFRLSTASSTTSWSPTSPQNQLRSRVTARAANWWAATWESSCAGRKG